jgi:hypothetical protein
MLNHLLKKYGLPIRFDAGIVAGFHKVRLFHPPSTGRPIADRGLKIKKILCPPCLKRGPEAEAHRINDNFM